MAEHCSSSTKVVENGRVSPPPGTVATTTIPLTFLDTLWLSCCPMQRLFFYEFPHTTSHFIQNTLPHLKNSLSLTLQHFFPFAGNLCLPPPSQRPFIFFTDGDSIPFIVTESDADFNHLIGNNPRYGRELQALVPKLPPPSTVVSDGTKQLSLMAIQVTIFPNAGFSIGITFFHAAADGKAFAHFTKSWASICKSKGDLSFIKNTPPIYTRDLVEDIQGIWSVFVEQNGELSTDIHIIPTDKLRVTYTINQSKVSTLKNWITRNNKKPLRWSTFVVTCAYVWVCLTKLQEPKTSEIIDDDDDSICHFIFQADCRDRLKLPKCYFGNCLQPCIATAKTNELLAENGIIVAGNAIGEAVMELDNGVMKEAEKWMSRVMDILMKSKHFVSVGGSPKLQVYETDFGWGRPKKSEVAHIGSYGSFSMAENRDGEAGGVEFGLALGSHQVDQFNVIFEQGFMNL